MEFIKVFELLFQKYRPEQLKDVPLVINEFVKIVKNENDSLKLYQLNYLLAYPKGDNFLFLMFDAYKKKYNVMHITSKVMDTFQQDKISPMVYSYFLYCILTVFKVDVRTFNWINPTKNTLENQSMGLEEFFGHGCFLEELSDYTIEDNTLKSIAVDRRYITIPHGVKRIEEEALSNITELDLITFPETLEELTFGQFADNLTLQKVLFSNKVKTIPGYYFKNCQNLFFINARGVREIEDNAFQGTKVSSLRSIAGARIEKIGNFAFKDCFQLKKIALTNLHEIGESPFYNCLNISEISIDINSKLVANKIQIYKLLETDANEIVNYTNFKNIIVNAKDGIIPDGFFENCTTVTHIKINGDIKQIGANAFKGCTSLVSLEMNYIGESLANGLFEECVSLEEFPKFNNVTRIRNNVFKGCVSLSELTFYNPITILGEGSFQNCINLKKINMQLITKELPDYCFSGCTNLLDYSFLNNICAFKSYCLEGIVLPQTFKFNEEVKYIASNAFNKCTFYDAIVIPDKCIIDELAFSEVPCVPKLICHNLKFKNIEKESFELYKLFDNDFESFLLKYESLKNIVISSNNVSSSSFNKWTQIESVVLNDVITIEESSFEGCINLSNVLINTNALSIYENAFKNCIKLSSIRTNKNNFDNNLIGVYDLSVCVQIKDNAFLNCNCTDVHLVIQKDPKLTNINLGTAFLKENSVSTLTNVTVTALSDSLPNGLFSRCTTIKCINVNGTISELSKELFKGCSSLDTVNIDFIGSVISESCFEDCTNLKKLPDFYDVDIIEDNAFKKCVSLDSISFNCQITSIGTSAFEGCTNLRKLDFELFIKELKANTFKDCPNIENYLFIKEVEVFKSYSLANVNLSDSFNIPNNIKKIEANAFYNSNLPSSIIIKKSINFEKESFGNVKGIKKIFFENVKLFQDENEFLPYALFTTNIDEFNKNFSSINSIEIDTTDIIDEAFKDWKFLRNITLTNNVVKLPKYCFKGCTAVTEITIPYYNMSLEEGVFSDCVNLSQVNFEENIINSDIVSRPNFVFKNCRKLSEISIYLDQFILDSGMKFYEYFEETEDEFNRNYPKFKTVDVVNSISTIPTEFFKGCTKVENISFVNQVEKFNSSVFMNCNSLSNLEVEFIGNILSDNLFNGCHKLNAFFDLSSVDTIEEKAFSNCDKLQNIKFNNEIVVIKENAFENCASLLNAEFVYKGLELPKEVFLNCRKLIETPKLLNLEFIHESAFEGCKKIKTLHISGFKNLLMRDVFANYPSISEIHYYTNEIPSKFFKGFTNQVELFFEDDLKIIRSSAFENCTTIFEFDSLNFIEIIEDDAFKNSTLKYIKIPEGIKEYGVCLFDSCNYLKKIEIPMRFDFIGELFSNQMNDLSKTLIQKSFSTEKTYYIPKSLQTIVINSGDIHEGSFSNVDVELIINAKLTRVKDYAFYNCSNLVINSMSDIKTVNDFAFANACIQTLTLTNVTSIGLNSFNNSKISNITIGNKISELNDTSFKGIEYNNFIIDKNIFFKIESNILIDIKKAVILNVFICPKNLIVPTEIQTLESNTFDNVCLETIDTNNVRVIKSNTFNNCGNLVNVTMPKVEKYDKNIFSLCPNISDLSLSFIGLDKNTHKTLEYLFDIIPSSFNRISVLGGTLILNVFKNITNINEVDLSLVKQDVFEDSLFKSLELNKLILPKQLVEIKDNAFNNVIINNVISNNDHIKFINNCIISNNKLIYCTAKDVALIVIDDSIIDISKSAFKLVDKIECVELRNANLTYLDLFDTVKEINSLSVCSIKDLLSSVFKKIINDINEIIYLDSEIRSQFFKGINTFNKLVFNKLNKLDLDFLTNKLVAIKTKKINIDTLIYNQEVTFIDEDIFEYISVNNLFLDEASNYFVDNNVLYNNDTKTLVYGCMNVKGEIFVCDDIIYTKQSAFKGCNLLEVINLNEIEEVSDNLFEECSSLRSVTINNCCKNIGKTIFKNCMNFDYIQVPFIGSNIEKTDKLTYLFGKDVFDVVIKTFKLTNQEKVSKTFNNFSNLHSVILGYNVLLIESDTFINCSSLSELYLNPNITTLPDYVFNGCSKHLRVNISKDVVKQLGTQWSKFGEDKKLGGVKVVAKKFKQDIFQC